MRYKNFYLLNAIISTGLIIGCAHANNNKTNIPTNIIYIDSENNIFSEKQPVFFRENTNQPVTNSNDVAAAIIKHAEKIPDLEIRITYKHESGLANEVANKVHAKVNNQIYIEHCCKLDSGRVNLKADQININYYKNK